jgi:hypothetical protein
MGAKWAGEASTELHKQTCSSRGVAEGCGCRLPPQAGPHQVKVFGWVFMWESQARQMTSGVASSSAAETKDWGGGGGKGRERGEGSV